MSRPYDTAIIVGSLRAASVNRLAAEALVRIAPPSLAMRFVEIGDLPLYNEDLEESGPPLPWTRFRDELARADAVLFVTPEYNRTVPGALKNAIDVGSRPYGASVWSGKPAAIMTLSPGGIGGFGANHSLRQSLVFLDMPAMQQPEAYVGGAYGLFDDDGAFRSDDTRAFFARFIDAFGNWVERTAAPAARSAS
ncbi:NAD(P)H-dependent oxidoreductase [Erythrobacteraceae bacterium CFH 75059]|uniref:NADPH-dependent FMN reductase n=1 Tax=Qipengyuania thermophila TaxID=2509361 RepID=UPI0010213846|nr:NADPH-dependent FMN reductase [Qipengyuania thermophila]TCD02069.1 NAD(P)H-dependent oxidoreductase [Erythrobacteraceae bacterium CFH 75059]